MAANSSNASEWEGIKFTWKIENFSYLKKESVRSPTYGTNSSVWDTNMYNGEDSISVSVHNLKFTLAGNNLSCSVAFLDCDGIPLIWKDQKIRSFSGAIYFHGFLPVGRLILDKTKFLQDDTLVIQCRLWQTPQGLTAPVSYFARTRIEPIVKVIKTTLSWDILDASSIVPPKSYIRNGLQITDDESYNMKLTLNNEDQFHVESTTTFKKIHMQITIAVLDATGKKIEFANCGNQFKGPDEKWSIFTNVTKRNVIFNRLVSESEILADYPRTTDSISDTSEASVSSDKPKINQPTKRYTSNTISEALQVLLQEGVLSDFNFRVGDRMFPVHKAILTARSEVFRAMFTAEMKEKDDNFVDIPDMDEDTLQRLLQFVYSDKFDEDMGWKRASSLYAAADKYALDSLKQECSAILKSELSVSNVLEVLSMADIHQDKDLKLEALDFTFLNDRNIIDTEIWIDFEEVNPKLALETCRKLYVKKING